MTIEDRGKIHNRFKESQFFSKKSDLTCFWIASPPVSPYYRLIVDAEHNPGTASSPKTGTRPFFTIGHSSHAPEHFVGLLQRHGIEVVVDTRSAPYSRYSPQFDREALRELLGPARVRYLYLGDVVGGRPKDESCYDAEGRVLYGRVARQPEFREAVSRLLRGVGEFRLALLCSEEDPAHCHRRLLIARVLMEEGAEVLHIRGDGALETEAKVSARSGKALIEEQAALFGELEEESWRSTGAIGKPAARSVVG